MTNALIANSEMLLKAPTQVISTCRSFAKSGVSFAALAAGLSLPMVSPANAVLTEIVVTAQKRAESMQDTPISMAAFTGSDLAARGATNISQIGEFTPNVQFDSSVGLSGSPNTSSIFIRGIGQPDFIAGSDPGVGVYLDGVYIARSTGGVLDLLDVERVEVLRGPQGTLFGRNTIGGAISVISKKPSDEFEASGELTIGNNNRIDAKAAVNLPLVQDKLFARVGVATRNSDGTGDFLLTGKHMGRDDTISGRAVIRYVANENLEFTFAADATHSEDESPIESLLAVNNSPGTLAFLYNLFVAPPAFDASYITPEHDTSFATGPTGSDMDIWGVAFTADWDLGAVQIKSITSYRTWDGSFGRDSDGSPLTIIQQRYSFDQEQFSQEINIGGSSFEDRLKWVLGGYYFQEDGMEFSDVPIVPETFPFVMIPFSAFGPNFFDHSSWATFGQATYNLTDRLSVTAGLRYTHEEKEADVQQSAIQIPGNPFLLTTRMAEVSFNSLTPKAALQYDFTDDFMVYASYSEGFKSGGFVGRYTRPAPAPKSFEPEEAATYELGFKGEFLNSILRLNGAAFYTEYENLQVVVFEAGVPNTRNAAAGEIRGFELEMTAVPTDGLTLLAGVGYLDAEYTEVDPTNPFIPITTDSKFVNTPEWSWNVGAEYSFPISNAGDLTLRADYSYKSEMANDAENTPQLMQEGFGLLNARATFGFADGGWELSLFGRNLTDEVYVVTGSNNFASVGPIMGVFGEPREWGVTAKVRF